MMEDLRITGYNALLTPAFLQEEFPPVSFSFLKKKKLTCQMISMGSVVLTNFLYSLRILKKHLLKLVMSALKFSTVKMIVLLSLLDLVPFTIPRPPRFIVSRSRKLFFVLPVDY